jgi:hypothetical protein
MFTVRMIPCIPENFPVPPVKANSGSGELSLPGVLRDNRAGRRRWHATFRTPANVYVAPSIIAGIRNPAQ